MLICLGATAAQALLGRSFRVTRDRGRLIDSPLAPIVLATHEWFGGGGYPQKLSGDEIPLASRVIAVADAYDAMTQTRAYRKRIDSSDAITELLRCCPVQFDPGIVAALFALLSRH